MSLSHFLAVRISRAPGLAAVSTSLATSIYRQPLLVLETRNHFFAFIFPSFRSRRAATVNSPGCFVIFARAVSRYEEEHSGPGYYCTTYDPPLSLVIHTEACLSVNMMARKPDLPSLSGNLCKPEDTVLLNS